MIQNAFPEYERQQPGERLYPGMTLRDYFAAVALQGVISGLATELLADSHDQVAGDAYRFADAMLRARETLLDSILEDESVDVDDLPGRND